MKTLILIYLLGLFGCGIETPLHPIGSNPPNQIGIVRQEWVPNPIAPPPTPTPKDCQRDDDCPYHNQRCNDAGSCECLAGLVCGPGETDPPPTADLVLTIQSSQNAAGFDTQSTPLISWDFSNLTDGWLGPVQFSVQTEAWFANQTEDNAQINPGLVLSNCGLWLVEDTGRWLMSGPFEVDADGQLSTDQTAGVIFEGGAQGSQQIRCDIGAAVVEGEPILLKVSGFQTNNEINSIVLDNQTISIEVE